MVRPFLFVPMEECVMKLRFSLAIAMVLALTSVAEAKCGRFFRQHRSTCSQPTYSAPTYVAPVQVRPASCPGGFCPSR